MLFRPVVVFLAFTAGHGWWRQDDAKEDRPWRTWALERFPTVVEYGEYLEEHTTSTRQTVVSWGEAISERGLWVVFDGLAGLFGWALFGTAWGDVKSGIRKIIQLIILVALCVVVHYVWAICWPVLSLVGAVIMTMFWICRKGLHIAGRIMYHVQRWCGGTPEAVDAEFFGPGTGVTPETSDLRRFKYAASAEKWIVIKRDGNVAVFKLSSESCSIRSSGLFAGIEPDTLRGSPGLLKDLRGHDQVHLCRSPTCAEEGQHFQIYGLAKKFDPVRFQLSVSGQGAKEAGETLWSWATKGSRVLAARVGEFGSESETEDLPCQGHRVRWSTDDNDEILSSCVCKEPAKEQVSLLQEDQFGSSSEVSLCPTHAAKYLLRRYQFKCSYQGCCRLGKVTAGGVNLCWTHESEAQRKRSRSRSRGRKEDEDREGQPEETKKEGDGKEDVDGGIEKLMSELKEIKGSLKREPERSAEAVVEEPRKRRLASRSPGVTPKSSVHRSLAKLGMLDSPDTPQAKNWLEEFFEKYMDGKELGLTEGQGRRMMAKEHGVTLADVSRTLHGLASMEQSKGQRGLTKFISLWGADFEEVEEPSFSSEDPRESVWSVVTADPVPQRVPEPPGLSPNVAASSGNPVMIAPPAIYGRQVKDRKAGAGTTTDSMTVLAQAIQSQTAEIASLVKAQHDQPAHPAGTLKGLSRLSEEMVFIMRACDQYHVAVCPGEVGTALANALIASQVGASTKLRALGFRQRMSSRLAVGLAGPFWGSQEKYCLTAADFVQYTDAELDAFSLERSNKPGTEQRPAPPTKIEEWCARARRQNQVWKLVYGEEWSDVREHAVETLAIWHQETPHKWPLQVVMDTWEELHWRFLEEIKELVRQIKKQAKRESLTLQELRFYALLPGPDGTAWLSLPRTFDLMNPEGWFKTELEPRIERKQERTLWRLTWDGGKRERAPQAGGVSGDKDKERGKAVALIGPKLTTEEVTRARDRAPVDKSGVLLCWSNLTHQGCQLASCQRSHEPLRGQFEQLDPAVRMQLLRRGGLRRMKQETPQTAEAKIKELRLQVAQDRTEKISKPKRKAGDVEEGAVEEASGKAGGESRVTFADIPEEFEAVDYTKQEDIQDLLKGPDETLGVPQRHQDRSYDGGLEKAPEHAQELVSKARRLSEGPVLKALEAASDDLYSWAAARVARDEGARLEDLLEEMALFGASDLAQEASSLLDEVGQSSKAGERPRLVVKETIWAPGEPGQGGLELDGVAWRTWDYQEEVMMSEELAAMMKIVEPVEEKRQCVTKTVAAGILWRRLGRRPTMQEVAEESATLRVEQAKQALDAHDQMGEAAEFVTPVEHELRCQAHDVLHPHHERDFRTLAVFPVQALEDAKVVVLRADVRGRLLVEEVVGPNWQPQGWTVFALIWKGHMVLAQPPEGYEVDVWLNSEEVQTTPVLGFSFYWHGRHDQALTAPGRISCRLCKPTRKAGERLTCHPRHSQLPGVAVAGGAAARPETRRGIRGDPSGRLVLRELFAGKATLTQCWQRTGGQALEPVEVYSNPHTRDGYCPDHDLLRPEVRALHLSRAKQGPENVGWVAAPCTSYCDWNIENGGSRTFSQPEGGVGRALTEREQQGNILSEFAADYFETMLDAGGFPIAESSGCSGRYPKQWDLPCWRRVLARSDVDFVEFRMCSFGLGPPNEPGAFYQHLTRVVFPKHEPLRAALSRRCPGVSANHRHVALKGARPGSNVTRCTEAGVYCPEFVQTVCEVG